MNISQIKHCLSSMVEEKWTTPAIISESNIFLLLSEYTKKHIISYEEVFEENMSNVSIYDIPEDRKEFSIETVRNCIIEIELRPYEGKHIYILRHFDTATIQAQNALLKVLEEAPEYAIILLEVENQNSILETIKSRTINLTENKGSDSDLAIWKEIIECFKLKQDKKLIWLLYWLKCTSSEAISILQWVYPYLSEDEMDRCSIAIESLSSTHENPRSILDSFFL